MTDNKSNARLADLLKKEKYGNDAGKDVLVYNIPEDLDKFHPDITSTIAKIDNNSSFDSHLETFARGEILNDTLIGDMIILESRFLYRVKHFLKSMKIEDTKDGMNSELSDLKELYLAGCAIIESGDGYSIKEKRIENLNEELKGAYDRLLKRKNYGAACFMNSLRNSYGLPINLVELLDFAEAENPPARVFTLIGFSFKDYDEKVEWLQISMLKGDYLAHILSSGPLEEIFNQKYEDHINFSASKTVEFYNLFGCKTLSIIMEIELKRKSPDFREDFMFFSKYYDTSYGFRKRAIYNAILVLTYPGVFDSSDSNSAACKFLSTYAFGKEELDVNEKKSLTVFLGALTTFLGTFVGREKDEDDDSQLGLGTFLNQCEERYKKSLKSLIPSPTESKTESKTESEKSLEDVLKLLSRSSGSSGSSSESSVSDFLGLLKNIGDIANLAKNKEY